MNYWQVALCRDTLDKHPELLSDSNGGPGKITKVCFDIHLPSEGEQFVFINGLELYHKPPDLGERQCKSKTCKR